MLTTLPITQEFDFTDQDFRFLVRMVNEQAGIVLPDRKRNLVYTRLSRRLRALGLDSFREYCRFIAGPDGATEVGAMVNAITTNLTAFFREKHHFDDLRTRVLPEITKSPPAGPKRLRIWSAGCSSGEEPYSIAMTLCAAVPDLGRWDACILATDLDTEMIRRADAGLYSGDQLQGIPVNYRKRFTTAIRQDGTVHIRMGEEIRRLITFKPLNLNGAWPMRGPFDIIFCRNVMIYFDKAAKTKLFSRFADILRPGGWLFVGHSESLINVTDRFAATGRTTYRRLA